MAISVFLLRFRKAFSRWIYTPPAPKHHVPDSYHAINIPHRVEDQIRAVCLLAHNAELVIFASTAKDRHLAAAEAGFTIPPPKLRVIEFPSGAKMYDYSMPAGVDRDEEWPPQGKDPLAGEAEVCSESFNRSIGRKPRK